VKEKLAPKKSGVLTHLVGASFLVVMIFGFFYVGEVVKAANSVVDSRLVVSESFDGSLLKKDKEDAISNYFTRYCRMRGYNGTYIDFKEYVDCQQFLYEI